MRIYPSYTSIYQHIPSYAGILRYMSGYQGVRIPDDPISGHLARYHHDRVFQVLLTRLTRLGLGDIWICPSRMSLRPDHRIFIWNPQKGLYNWYIPGITIPYDSIGKFRSNYWLLLAVNQLEVASQK
jgi:hypothetical protein